MPTNRVAEFSSNGTGRAKPKPATRTRATKGDRQAATRRATWAKVCGAGCVVGLALSGIDSTLALHRFANVELWRAAMLALVVDGLLVGAEITELLSHGAKDERTIRRWSVAYVISAGLVSVGLNGAEFASHATTAAGQVLNAVLGGLIPLLVLVASRYAGHAYLSAR